MAALIPQGSKNKRLTAPTVTEVVYHPFDHWSFPVHPFYSVISEILLLRWSVFSVQCHVSGVLTTQYQRSPRKEG